jgi:hypothetical protein
MLDDAIHFLAETQDVPNWERLGQHLPVEWIEQAVQYTGKASIRQRRLPAEQVVWLVVALALYRHQSISEVLDDLELALPDLQVPYVSKSAIAQARQRVGQRRCRCYLNCLPRRGVSKTRSSINLKGCAYSHSMVRP